jgi:hypothetical protein
VSIESQLEAALLNLTFPPVAANARTTSLTTDFSVMLVGIVARQAASPTAMMVQARRATVMCDSPLLTPVHGAFNAVMALRVKRWKEAEARRPD